MDHYSTPELLQASGLTAGNFKQLISRGHLGLSSGQNPGTGNRRQHSRDDVLQAAVVFHLGQVGIPPRRARMVWYVALANLHRPDAVILFGPRDDDSDLDFRVVLPGQDGGMDSDDAPPVFAALNLGALKRRVDAKLAALGLPV